MAGFLVCALVVFGSYLAGSLPSGPAPVRVPVQYRRIPHGTAVHGLVLRPRNVMTHGVL